MFSPSELARAAASASAMAPLPQRYDARYASPHASPPLPRASPPAPPSPSPLLSAPPPLTPPLLSPTFLSPPPPPPPPPSPPPPTSPPPHSVHSLGVNRLYAPQATSSLRPAFGAQAPYVQRGAPSSSPCAFTSSASGSHAAKHARSDGVLYDAAKLLHMGCVLVHGRVYNQHGHVICGVLNQHNQPCKRIGKCPFHALRVALTDANCMNAHLLRGGVGVDVDGGDGTRSDSTCVSGEDESLSCASLVPTPQRIKRGWTREEHYLFLEGLLHFGRGNWRQIATLVQSKSGVQVQSHAQKFFQRQARPLKFKRSIHDLHLNTDEMQAVRMRLRRQRGGYYEFVAQHRQPRAKRVKSQ